MMNKKYLFFFLILINTIQGQNLLIQNGSFDGPPAPAVTPPGWTECMPNQSPDTQPGSWGVDIVPSEGNSYLGLVHNVPMNYAEGASQELTEPMEEGIEYNCLLYVFNCLKN